VRSPLADLVTLDAPALCLMLGEGNGGGATDIATLHARRAAKFAGLG
jgi:acetyl-CoA carboxylase carboxyl transferase subunit beta